MHGQIEQTIRLVYFDVIVAKFEQAHQSAIDAARAEATQANLGVEIPADFSRLNRAQALELSNKLEGVDVSGHANLQTLRDLVRDGWKKLDLNVIPSTWIG